MQEIVNDYLTRNGWRTVDSNQDARRDEDVQGTAEDGVEAIWNGAGTQFTYMDENAPNPEAIRTQEAIVLPEITTMTGYIERHYGQEIEEDLFRKIRSGDLWVKAQGYYFVAAPDKELPWKKDNAERTIDFPKAWDDPNYRALDRNAEITPKSASIVWADYYREWETYVRAQMTMYPLSHAFRQFALRGTIERLR